MRTTRVVRAFRPARGVCTTKRPSGRAGVLMHCEVSATERASVAIGVVARAGLSGAMVAAMFESTWGGDHIVLAYLVHL